MCNLVRVKLGFYELEAQSSVSPEDYLKLFMETEVKPLWPKGWMQARCVSHHNITYASTNASFVIYVGFYIMVVLNTLYFPKGCCLKRVEWLMIISLETREFLLSFILLEVFMKLSCFDMADHFSFVSSE